jgi:Protein of unknown function (DUF2802)
MMNLNYGVLAMAAASLAICALFAVPALCFDQAIDFARRGTDPGRLTQQFGLSRAEADLVTRLHGRKQIA